MAKTKGPARGIKWKPNGVVEQSVVNEEIGRVSESYAAIVDKLKRIADEAEQLKERLRRPEVEHVENGR